MEEQDPSQSDTQSEANNTTTSVATASPLPTKRSRRSWICTASVIGLSLLLITTSSVLISLKYFSQSTPVLVSVKTKLVTTSTSTDFPTTATLQPTSTPAPTATPNPQAVRNANMGCINGKPLPLPGVLVNGMNPNVPQTPIMEVALTFDDGPTSYSTAKVIDALEQQHVPATFFVEGNYALNWPDLLKREWVDGFAIGTHSWDHPDLRYLSDAALRHQFGDTLDQIHQVIGADACIWLSRPPYGSINPHIVQFAQSYGLSSINWDDAGLDWTLPGSAKITANVLNLLRPGSIILLHDGPAAREQTADAIAGIVAGIKARGYKLVTLPQLLADGKYPGISLPPGDVPSPMAPTPIPSPTPMPTPTDMPTPKVGPRNN